MDEQQKPPPKRGRESREESREKPKGEVNPMHDRIERGMGPLRPDPAGDQYSPHAKRMPFQLRKTREGNLEAPHVQTGNARVDANATQRWRDAQIGMNVTRGRVGIWPMAREAHQRSGCPPRDAGISHGRSRGWHMDPNTPNNRADTACGTEARRYQAITGKR